MMRWVPAGVLALGVMFTIGVDTQRTMPLRAPLAGVLPTAISGHEGADRALTAGEAQAVGVTDYLVRTYGSAFWLYVGYYDRQTQGRSIHSPRNCLPGAGWEPLASGVEAIETSVGTVTVNRYLIRRGTQQALVFYWYQGRGRVEANEYRVKFDLLRDAMLRGRTDEALVRIVVPVSDAEAAASALGRRAVQTVVPAVARALPA